MNTSVYAFGCGIPGFISDISETPAMQRLKGIGMSCGCEYTSFPVYASLKPVGSQAAALPPTGTYSRFEHSLGAALITWRFTRDRAASAAALLHDVATPVFAHTVDFLNGDYMRQESTEERTAAVICSCPELTGALARHGLSVPEVSDYHIYPVADNDAPKLSADRLEYSLGNMLAFGIDDEVHVREMFSSITLGQNESGEDELVFSSLPAAERFAVNALACSKIYVSPEDRYAMQILSEILAKAVSLSVITTEDLYFDEPRVIAKLAANADTRRAWEDFRRLSRMVSPEEHPERSRVIHAKKRRIDPLVQGEGRLSELSGRFRSSLDDFMAWDFSAPVAGI